MTENQFARDYMKKLGWNQGDGLGLNKQGIPEPIKVKKKSTTAGLGHDPAKDFTVQWWDHVFNEAASKVTVTEDDSGLNIRTEAPKHKKKDKTKKKALYGGFQKKSTLEGGFEKDETVAEGGVQNSSEKTFIPSISTLTDNELFEACGGRTAHKGARHGHKMKGKLARLQRQEAELIQTLQIPNRGSSSKLSDSETSRMKADMASDYKNYSPVKDNPSTDSARSFGSGNLNSDPTLVDSGCHSQSRVKKKKRKSKPEMDTLDWETPASSLNFCDGPSIDIKITAKKKRIAQEKS